MAYEHSPNAVEKLLQNDGRPHPLLTHKVWAGIILIAATVAMMLGVSQDVIDQNVGSALNILAILVTMGVLHRKDENKVTPAGDPFLSDDLDRDIRGDS